MPELRELANELTNIYQNRISSGIRPGKLRDAEKDIWDHFENLIPSDMFGEIYTTNKTSIHKAVQKTNNWWQKEFDVYEDLIISSVDRVIEGAKEDVAEERGEDKDPRDIGEDELDDEVLFQWWPQEWSHNVDGRHWIAKFFDRKNISLQDVRNYGLEDAVQREFIDPIKNTGFDFVEDFKNILFDIDQRVNKKHVIKWVFGYEEDPIEWEVWR